MLMLLLSVGTLASESISYSGRLVNSNGSPVSDTVNLTFQLAYSSQPGAILCSEAIDGVALVNGVFHVKLEFLNCNLKDVLAKTPSGHTVNIRVIDRTPEPDKTYSFQAVYSVPFSFVSQLSKQLVKMGANDGDVLTWDNISQQWIPRSIGGGNGLVTSITATDGLSGGTITDTGTIGIANNGVTSARILDDTIIDADISATAEISQSKIKNLITDLAAKESLIGTGSSTDYLNGAKVWNNFDQSVRNTLLLGYATGSATPLSSTDNVMEALGKLEGQIIANDTAFDNAGQWDKDGSLIYYNTGNVGVGTASPSEKLEVVGNIAISGKMRLKDSGNNYVELKSPTTIAGTVTFTLPGSLGTNGQVLVTDASGNLSWSTPSTSSADIVDGSIVDADISGSANIAQSKIANLATDLAAKEPALIAGTAAQYLRGDKSWQTLNTDAVVEGTKLYFTEPRVLDTDLTGLSSVAGSVTATDSILSAIGKLAGNQSNYLLRAGDSMSGNLLMAGNTVTGLAIPLLDSDAATKLYVDSEISNKAYWTKTGNDLSYSTGNVGVGTSTPTNRVDVVGDVALSGKLRLKSDTANYVELRAPIGLGSIQTYIFPSTTGTSGYALTTNGTGTLSWSAVATTSTSVGGDLSGTIANANIVSGAVGSTEIADLSIVNVDIANSTITYGKLNLIDGDIPQAKVNGLITALGGKEPTITAGTTAQYWRGDKSWQTLNTNAVPEGTNLYFLDSRVRGALMSGYATGLATPVAATDNLLEALGKLEGQIIANKTTFDSTGQWSKNGTSVYYTGGNVGIGTSTPMEKLHINGDLYVQGQDLWFSHDNVTNTNNDYIAYDDNAVLGSNGVFIFKSDTIRDKDFTTPSGAIAAKGAYFGGNVGIGSTSPAEKLDVQGNMILTGKARFKSSTSTYVELNAPTTLASTISFSLPGTLGTNGQVLTSDGTGLLNWTTISTSPTGAAGGDLAGSYPNPSVVKIRGKGVSTTVPTSGQVLKFNGVEWAPAADTDTDTNTTYTAGTGLALSGNTFSLPNAGTSGTYGSASSVPVITTDVQGRVTNVINTNIAIAGSAITSGTVASARLPATVSHLSNTIESSEITDGTIQAVDIANQTITNTKLNGIAANCSAGTVLVADGAGGFSCTSINLGRVTYSNSLTTNSSITIPESVISSYCADEDGCEMRIAMYNWDGTGRTASRSFLFYYNSTNKTWRSSTDGAGTNGDGTVAHPYTVWSCYFTDGSYLNGASQGDGNADFALLNWTEYANETCRLTIIN